MTFNYDDDDYELDHLSDDFIEGFTLDDDELDQYEDVKHSLLDDMAYQINYAEDQLINARRDGEGSDGLERLEDELELLLIDYHRLLVAETGG